MAADLGFLLSLPPNIFHDPNNVPTKFFPTFSSCPLAGGNARVRTRVGTG